jgi:hypothetical protein
MWAQESGLSLASTPTPTTRHWGLLDGFFPLAIHTQLVPSVSCFYIPIPTLSLNPQTCLYHSASSLPRSDS